MAFVHCANCGGAFSAARTTRCLRCGTFLGAAAPAAEQVAECVDRLGMLLANASPEERQVLADGLMATPPCQERETTRWTNAVGNAIARTVRGPERVPMQFTDDRASVFALGFWLGVATTVRQIAMAKLAARRLR